MIRVAKFKRAIGVALTVCALGRADGWYADASRPDDKGDGRTPATAWKTFHPFVGKVVGAGDTLHLKRGSRWDNTFLVFYHGGTAAKPFVATAYGDESLPLPSISDTSSKQAWVIGLASSHLVVEKIAVHGPNGSCATTVSDSVTDVVIQDMEVSDCQSGIALAQVDGAIIQRNRVWNIHFPSNLNGGGGGAIAITLDGCRNIKVLDNLIRDAIDGNPAHEDGGAVELFRRNSNIEIAGNRARNTAGFLEIGGLVQDHDTARNVVIHHNVAQEVQNFLWCSVATAKDTSSQWGMAYSEVYVDNNTQIQDGRRAGLTVGVSLHLEDSTQIRVRNNLFVGDSQAGFLFFGPFERKNNLFWSMNFPSKYEKPYAPGEKSVDPLIHADTTNLTYALDMASPARDAGAALVYPPSLGSLRLPTIPDGKPDIGALEMSSTSLVPTAQRFQGALRGAGNRVEWNGWANAPGTLSARLMDAQGRVVFSERRSHAAGAVVRGWDLPKGRGVMVLAVEMDGIRQAIVVAPGR
ncbi:MAG: right-handed parallel beta-helix repeat-containing protein [Fibrobacteres bacterium]|nr:right-handed parallel beta-helix repeat-containing protein [Fibrobacterota bacterium]